MKRMSRGSWARFVPSAVCVLSTAWVAGGVLSPASAADLSSLQLLSQSEFRQLAQDLGGIASFKGLASATPLGVTGFDVATSLSWSTLAHREVWNKAAAGLGSPSGVPVPALRLAKGGPWGLDVGVMASTVPATGAQLSGAELRWALIEGGPVTPALGLRLHATRLSGVKQLSLGTSGFDVTLSKGFALVTPYIGAGALRTAATAQVSTALAGENLSTSRLFAGAHLNFGLFDVTLEADRSSDLRTVSGRLGYRF
jgi:hypothetical protein